MSGLRAVARDPVGLAALVASGACALVLEAVWSHWFAVAFGSSALATAATRTAFLAALASGVAVAAILSLAVADAVGRRSNRMAEATAPAGGLPSRA